MDLVSAILWWHPLIWWARRQLHITSETAADEASCVIANGPATLAECLVELGARLLAPRSFGGMGIGGRGFQTELGRRVERLIQMKESAWHPIISWRSGLVKVTGPLVLVVAIILCTAWVPSRAINQGDSMKTLQQNWKHSLAGFALAAVIGTDLTAGTVTTPSVAMAAEWAPLIKTAVESKLERTIIKDLAMDGLPLSEVLKLLSDEALKQDPDKTGINFIISVTPTQNSPQASADPGSGQAVSAEAVDLASVNIRLYLPIRNVRLKDILEVLVKVADRPLKYTVEDYGVVFSPATPPIQAASVTSAPSSSQTQRAFDTETIRRLEASCLEARANYSQMQAMLTKLLSLSGPELRDVLPTVWPDAILTQLLTSYAQTDQELTTLRGEYGEEHPNVVRAKALLDKIDTQIDRKVKAILTGLQTKTDALKDDLAARTKTLKLEEETRLKQLAEGQRNVKW
jgi:hypothetical protein